MSVDAQEERVRLVTGRDSVLRLSQELRAFSERCAQQGAVDDLAYFLSKPGALPRIPHLLLVGKDRDHSPSPDFSQLSGAVLIFEQQIGGVGLGAYATNDRSGRSTVLAMPEDRVWVAGAAMRALLKLGAHLVLMSFRPDGSRGPGSAIAGDLLNSGGAPWNARWAWRERMIPEYLPLLSTLDETLATLGTRTRRNLRYYRKRADTDLRAQFVPQVKVTREELLEFNRHCMYAVPSKVAGWRYDCLKELDQPILMGLRNAHGEWLSMLGGRRYMDRSEILWQMNRAGLEHFSLGTAMRTYFLEHEIAQGARRVYTEGGTPHTMRHSFVHEPLVDMVVQRATPAAKAMRAAARWYIQPDNELSKMLDAPDVEWRSC